MALVTSTTIEVAEMHLFNSRRALQTHGSLIKVSSWQMYIDLPLLISKNFKALIGLAKSAITPFI